MATPNTSGAIARITKEIGHIQKGTDLSLAVACRDSDVRHVRALIIGPPETPYEYGFFEFDIKFGKEYPIKSPHVRAITTNSGKCRFNPNIYNCGKVCLSILGTWRGQPGEEWSSAQGLESILLSIQSLMSHNPYENEPGYETAKKDEVNPKAYVAKIRHETLRVAVIQRLEGLLGIEENKVAPFYKKIRSKTHDLLNQGPAPIDSLSKSPVSNGNDPDGYSTPNTDTSAYEYDAEAAFAALDSGQWDPFIDLMKRRFLWYYDSYIKTVEHASKEQADGKAFARMEFEYPPNSLEGNFDYAGLERRLKRIAQALEDERMSWEKQAATQVALSTQIATQLAFQFKQLAHKWNDSQYACSKTEIKLPNPQNPFVWHLTLFGKPMSNLDGGIFNMTLSIPPDFPYSQPRLKFETPIFHHRVSGSGYLCYFPEREDEISSHLEAIVAAIEDEKPNYDPRAVVNPGAFQLYWGGDEKRKFYNRKLRRSAQESTIWLNGIGQVLQDEYDRLASELAEIKRVSALQHHKNPPKPFDFMIFENLNVNEDGEGEDEILDRRDATWHAFVNVMEMFQAHLQDQRPEEFFGRTGNATADEEELEIQPWVQNYMDMASDMIERHSQ